MAPKENLNDASMPVEVNDLLLQESSEHARTFEATMGMLGRPFAEVLTILERSLRAGGKLLLFGNGGSAADAQHIAAELIIQYHAARAPMSGIALSTDTSVLTACGNDLGFGALFARQIEALGRTGD